MKTIVMDLHCAAVQIARQILCLRNRKTDCGIAFGADGCVYEVLKCLQALVQDTGTDLTGVRFYSVQEYCGVDPMHSLNGKLKELLSYPGAAFSGITEENAECYDRTLEEEGGLDLIVLGLGDNSSVGFNEPGTPFASGAHLQKLTRPTREERASEFDCEENVPEFGATMGIRSIVKVPEILLITAGKSKAKAVFDMLYARDDSLIPSAFLQLPGNVTVYADEQAASLL